MSPITTTPKSAQRKSVLSDTEIALVLEGLKAGAQKYARLAQDADEQGFRPQAAGFRTKSAQFEALSRTAGSVRISRMTVRHN